MGNAAQSAVNHQVLGAAPPPAPAPGPGPQPPSQPGQQWILVPNQPSGNAMYQQQYAGQNQYKAPQTGYLEYENHGGAPGALPPQPSQDPLPVLQLQQPVLPPLIPKPQATEPVLGKDTNMEEERISKLQVDGSDGFNVADTWARIEEIAKTRQKELQKGLASLEKMLYWMGSLGVQSQRQADRIDRINQDIVALKVVHESTTAQSTIQFKTQQEMLTELTLMLEAVDANRKSQMKTLMGSMRELGEKTWMIAQARVPHAQQEMMKNLGMNVVRCQDAAEQLTRLIENCLASKPAFRNNPVNIPL